MLFRKHFSMGIKPALDEAVLDHIHVQYMLLHIGLIRMREMIR